MNEIAGTLPDVMKQKPWTEVKWRKLGVLLLHRAYSIMQQDDERQIREQDI